MYYFSAVPTFKMTYISVRELSNYQIYLKRVISTLTYIKSHFVFRLWRHLICFYMTNMVNAGVKTFMWVANLFN